MRFLRTISTRRLIAGCALTVALVVAGVAVAGAAGSGGSPPPPKALDAAVHDAITASKPVGVTARIHFTNNLIASGALNVGSPLLAGADGRLWISGGHVRLELQSDAGDAQISFADGRLSIYDASSNTVYRADIAAKAADQRGASDHGAPSVTEISSALTQLAEQAAVSGAEPTTQAGQPAYDVSITPKHDAGLLGRAEVAWDAANGVPLRVAVTAAGSNSPVLALEVTDIAYGSVDPSAFAITPPASAKIVNLGSLTHAGGADGTTGSTTEGLSAVGAAVPFTLAAPDSLVGLPRTGVRLISDGKQPTALVTYGKGLGAIAVVERSTTAGDAAGNPLNSLPSVTIDGATGHELPTALGTLVSVERGGVSYTLVGSLPPNAAEAALRAVLA